MRLSSLLLAIWTITAPADGTTTSAPVNAAERWVTVNEVMNWHDANQYCADTFGTQLATVRNMVEAQALADMVKGFGYQVWSGLNDLADENVEEWASGCPCGTVCDAIKQEDGDTGSEDCFRAQYWGRTTNLLRDASCDSAAYRIICDLSDDPCDATPPSTEPTTVPSIDPTSNPTTESPTAEPTASPTPAPTDSPSADPTADPTTVSPSADPTAPPTACNALETCARLDAVEDAVDGLQDAVHRLDVLEQAVDSLENTMAAMSALLAAYGADSE